MWEYNYVLETGELYHFGVPGMKWGVRKTRPTNRNSRIAEQKKAYKKTKKEELKNTVKTLSKKINEAAGGELSKRGKSAIDVLVNGDTDWMGHKITSDDSTTEMKNRGKAALERMLYSQKQIDNKKFFGRYNF